MDQKEPSFPHFLELPLELSSMVVDDMRGDDRCRFSGCSRLSNKEAKLSKKFIYALQFAIFSDYKATLTERFDRDPNARCCVNEFRKISGKTVMIRKTKRLADSIVRGTNVNTKELCRVKLSNSTNLVNYAVEHLKNLLSMYENRIRVLIVYDKRWPQTARPFTVDLSKNLEELVVMGVPNSMEFLSNTKGPLKNLCIGARTLIGVPMDKIYQVKNDIWVPGLELNNEQFLQLSASKIFMNIGQLTPQDLFNFIRSWQNGTIGRKVRSVCWYWDEAWGWRDHASELHRLLGLREPNWSLSSEVEETRFAHFKEPRREGKLVFYEKSFGVAFDDEALIIDRKDLYFQSVLACIDSEYVHNLYFQNNRFLNIDDF